MQIFNSFHPLKRSHITPPIGLFFITWFEILKFRFHPVHDRIGLRKLLLQLVQNGVFRISRVEDAVHMTGHPGERAVLDNAGPHHRPHIDHEQVGTGHPYPGKPRSFRLVAAIAVQLVTVNFEKTIRQTIPRFVFLTPSTLWTGKRAQTTPPPGPPSSWRYNPAEAEKTDIYPLSPSLFFITS